MPNIEQEDVLARALAALEEDNVSDIRLLMSALHPADVAKLLEGLPPEQRPAVWYEVPTVAMGEVLTEVSDGVREGLTENMDRERLVEAVRTLDIDDIADVVPDLPEDAIARILLAVDTEARQELDAVLAYDEDSAGGLMNTDTTTIRASITLAVVLRYLRQRGEMPEYTDKLFVINRNNTLKGILFVSDLLTNDPGMRVGAIADTDPFIFNANTQATDVAHAFARYNLISAPVVDEAGKLLGRITIDDVVDVIREEADHTMMAQAGLDEEEDIFAPVTKTARSRALWLGVNLITAFAASYVIGRFAATIEQLVALAVLMPIVASMGGNAGMQTLTVVIRGLAVGTITRGNARRLLRKEFLVGGLNGIIWAIVVALVAGLWFQNLELALIVAVAMIINLAVSAVAGVVIPILCDRFNVDPALASGVALTTITDIVGFWAILGLAAVFLL